MARRPASADPEQWRAERAAVWARRNRVLNVAMLVAVAAVLVRFFACEGG